MRVTWVSLVTDPQVGERRLPGRSSLSIKADVSRCQRLNGVAQVHQQEDVRQLSSAVGSMTKSTVMLMRGLLQMFCYGGRSDEIRRDEQICVLTRPKWQSRGVHVDMVRIDGDWMTGN